MSSDKTNERNLCISVSSLEGIGMHIQVADLKNMICNLSGTVKSQYCSFKVIFLWIIDSIGGVSSGELRRRCRLFPGNYDSNHGWSLRKVLRHEPGENLNTRMLYEYFTPQERYCLARCVASNACGTICLWREREKLFRRFVWLISCFIK